MNFFKNLFRSKIFWSVLIVLVAIRLVIPPLMTPKLNEFLATFSPTFKGHVDSVGLSIFRGAFKMHGFELRLKEKPDERFFYSNYIETSIAWRDFVRGRITTDVLVEGTQIVLTKNVLDAFKKASKKDQEETKEKAGKLFPLRVERIDIRNSGFEFAEVASLPEASRWKISDIDGRISNITPAEEYPITMMTIDGSMFDSTVLKVAGQINQMSKPTVWDIDAEVRDFSLRQANPVIAQKLPLSFTSGTLDLYSEIKSEDKKMVGYIKPFVKNADVVANKEKFEGVKGFGIEVSTAAVNLILRDAKDKTLATKVMFTYENGEFKINSLNALAKAIQNGFEEDVPEGIDDEISLSAKNTKADLKGE